MTEDRKIAPDNLLMSIIKSALEELELRGDIVVSSDVMTVPADFLHEKLLYLVPSCSISTEELIGLRSLVFHAIEDKRFFDWEMPTLTGFNAEEFASIAEKLPKG